MKSPLPLLALFFTVFNYSALFAQAPSSTVEIKQLGEQGILLDKGWKYQAGDNPQWRQPGYDDQSWQPINPTKDIMDIPQLWKTDIGWFRLRFTVDSSLTQKGLVLLVKQTGASEIYLNGRLLKQFGEIRDNGRKVQSVSTVFGTFIEFPVSKPGEQVLAVRFALQKNLPYIGLTGGANPTLALQVLKPQAFSSYLQSDFANYFDFLRGGLFLILSVLHLALFLYNPKQKANLYFLFYTLINCLIGIVGVVILKYAHLTAYITAYSIFFAVGTFISYLFFLTAVYVTFNFRRGFVYWILGVLCVVSIVVLFTHYHYGFFFGSIVFLTLIYLEAIRITLLAIKEKQRGAKLVIAGAVGFLVFFLFFNLFGFGYLPAGPHWIYGYLALNISLLSMPIAISVFLALESSFASRTLEEKLKEVELLSQRTLEQEQEKQQLLASQNETLEKKVTERTTELRQSLQELKDTQTQLVQREKMASLGELTAGIAHEIQNPLNFVNNFSELSTELVEELKQEIKTDHRSEALEIANDLTLNLQKITLHGQRAGAIVKGMLQHSRTSSGEKEATDINALVDEYLRLSYHGLRAKDKEFNTSLITDFDSTMKYVEVVPQEIGRVLLNLFNNAFYATQQKKSQLNGQYQPEVKVSTSCHDGNIEIKVRDNGGGIPENMKSKIFQPFFTTKPTGQGTGLGLSLSYDIVTKGHGGELRLETKEGEFAEFIIKLPA